MTRTVDRDQIAQFARALFRYASDGRTVVLRSFKQSKQDAEPVRTESVTIGGDDFAPVIEAAVRQAQEAANHRAHLVFASPIAGFKNPHEPWRARTEDLGEGYTLSVDCDQSPNDARQKLEALLGPATVVVASGGQWLDRATFKWKDKLHLHWRLSEPTRDKSCHDRLREARKLAAELVGADASAVPIVHPFRWPGSWHRKERENPRPCRIVAIEQEREIELGDALERLRKAVPAKVERVKNAPEASGKDQQKFQADVLDVTAALTAIPNPDLPWDEWNRIGMATWSASNGQAFAAFDAWSQKSEKYDPEATRDRWEHYETSPPVHIGAGTLFHEAYKAVPGWRKPSELARPGPALAAPRSSPVVIHTAYDLRAMEFPDLKFVVRRYIVEGATLLAGRPKIGKSWFVLQVGLAVAEGAECFGEDCEQGDVLYLALEDNAHRLQRRIGKLRGRLFVERWPKSFHYATEWPRADTGGIDRIRDWAKSVEHPRLVIIDVFAMFRSEQGDRKNQYESDYRAVKRLQALASELGLAIVIVHHTRKGKEGEEADPFEKVSGTLGLSGAADTTLVLDRDGNGTTLYGRGRDIEEIETAVQFDREACLWQVLGEASQVRQTDERKTVIKALEEANEPMSPKDLGVATGMPGPNVRQLLFKMANAGQVKKVARGLYVRSDAPIGNGADGRHSLGSVLDGLDFDLPYCPKPPVLSS